MTSFDPGFRETLGDLIAWRRDVRRFRADPVDDAVLRQCLDLACLSPSVGNSQPWRFVRVTDPDRRAAVVIISSAATAMRRKPTIRSVGKPITG